MTFLNLHELEALAKERLTTGAFGYIRSGAEDEVALRENRAAFERLKLLPRMLVDVSQVDLSTEVLGRTISMPVMLAPVAFQTLTHPDGELASARAAAAADTLFAASTLSSHPLEAIAAASDGPKWFQLYCSRDKELTYDLIARAEAAGFEAICVTADIPVAARRETDERNRFSLPPACLPGNLARHMPLDDLTDSDQGSALVRLIGDLFDPSLSWRDIEALRARTRLPFLVKGILAPDDARRAIDHGLDGIVVSNHGGRQLDCAPASIDVLPAIAEVVDGRIAVLLDSGIRRGSDVVTAVALGAQAVLIGRPMMWGLAIDGQQGVTRVLEMLREEIARTLGLIGCPSLRDLESGLVLPSPPR